MTREEMIDFAAKYREELRGFGASVEELPDYTFRLEENTIHRLVNVALRCLNSE